MSGQLAVREDDVVAALAEIVSATNSNRILVGIGDDAAVWQPSRSHRSVITTDMLVEGIHFTREGMSMYEIGWRAMTANASDVAAMGARGLLATIALGVPETVALDDLKECYRGLAACARACGLAIVGGDLSRAPALTLAIAVTGEVRPSNLKLRSTGRAGDVLAVTGQLGASRAGLDVLSDRVELFGAEKEEALRAHRTPVARMEAGRWLGASANVHAMMDCSDGISTDVARIARASGLGACIEEVPVAPSASEAARALGVDPQTYAFGGGEDFELLAAVAPRAFAHVSERYRRSFGAPLYRIGHLRADAGIVVRKNGREAPLASTGWDHFV